MIDVKYEELEGITWEQIGKRDCYALVRDFYKINFDMNLTDFPRPADWSADEVDLIRALYEREGFQMITDWKVKDVRPGDVLAFIVGEGNPNHLGIYLGDGEFLHHLYNRFSRKEPFQGFWQRHVSFILRHPDVPDLSPPKITQDLEEFIYARNHPAAE